MMAKRVYLSFLARCESFDRTWIAAPAVSVRVQWLRSGSVPRPETGVRGTLVRDFVEMNLL